MTLSRLRLRACSYSSTCDSSFSCEATLIFKMHHGFRGNHTQLSLWRYLSPWPIFFTLGCSHALPLAPDKSPSPSTTLEQIKTLIGGAPCEHNDQCKTLALGAKACGGPEFFLAWSTVQTPSTELADLASRYTAMRLAQVAGKGLVSDCRLNTDPGASCQFSADNRAGQCVLQTPKNGGASNLPQR
jgi:hypothetical protein